MKSERGALLFSCNSSKEDPVKENDIDTKKFLEKSVSLKVNSSLNF